MPFAASTGDAMANADLLTRVAEAMPQAAYVGLEGLDHAQTFARSDIVLPHVLAFLARVESRPAADGWAPPPMAPVRRNDVSCLPDGMMEVGIIRRQQRPYRRYLTAKSS